MIIKLPCYGIMVQLSKRDTNRGYIVSNLHVEQRATVDEYEAAIDAVESLILAHACAGVDIKSPAYIEGIETCIDAISNNID